MPKSVQVKASEVNNGHGLDLAVAGALVLFVEKIFAANLFEGGKTWGLTRHDFFRCYPLRSLSGFRLHGLSAVKPQESIHSR